LHPPVAGFDLGGYSLVARSGKVEEVKKTKSNHQRRPKRNFKVSRKLMQSKVRARETKSTQHNNDNPQKILTVLFK
jgi:hypothetical protein